MSPSAGPRALLITPFELLVGHRQIIEAFVRRDIRSRYVASVLGLSWAVIYPTALLILYTFVFSSVLKVRFGGSDSATGFAFYLFCGMLPWLAFTEGVVRSASVVLEQTALIKKVVFPVEILPAYVVTSALVMEFVALAIFVPALGVFRGGLGWPILVLPVVILLQFLFTLGLGWLLASLNVFLRDVGHVLGLVMTTWMFVTPIFYPADLMPARFSWLLTVNPMYYVIQAYRDLLLENRIPAGAQLVALALIAMSTFLAGHWFFRRSKAAFVDVL